MQILSRPRAEFTSEHEASRLLEPQAVSDLDNLDSFP